MFGIEARTALAAGAMLLAAACTTDQAAFNGSGGGGGGGGSPSPLAVTTLGVTGEGGVTEKLGVAALTDPLLGTEGVLGGGDEGLIGGQVPAEITGNIEPVRDGLEEASAAINENLPLGMVTEQVPSLGIAGEDGLVYDIAGQDPAGMVLGGTGTIPALVGGGNEGALGDAVPEGAVPGLPDAGGSDPLATVTDLLGGGLPGLPGLPGGGGDDPLAPVTDALAPVTDALGGTPDLPGADALAPVTDIVGGLAAGELPAIPGT
ncbi:MAG: hypothetical protein CVT73_00510 [Alphaproteobacteria bacterium HGW-Alphaproteobacteria-12]|nr:MAG: hypothetical protein CVT73_00510 [Alphaproteobacteria bacterium HGW-Alphaproteobacteria-12]